MQRGEYVEKRDQAIESGGRAVIETALNRWRFERSKQGREGRCPGGPQSQNRAG